MSGRVSVFQVVSIAALGTCAYLIAVQLLNRGAGLSPTPKIVANSARVIPAKGGVDERTSPVPPQSISGTGVIEPLARETKVAAASAGLIVRIAVNEGDRVKAGQTLAELESSAERAAVESAREEIESARRDLDRVKAGERTETVAAARQDLEAARAKAALSAESMRRLEGLSKKDLATRDEFDRAVRTAEQDRASAAAAQSRYEALANGPRSEDVAVQQARVAQAEKKLAEKETALRLRAIRAPSAGTILQIKYRAGEYYTPGGEPLMLMGDLAKRRARIDIDERDIGRVAMGASAYVSAPAYPDRRFPARVAEIGQRIGRKNVRTDDPKERIDTKILEIVLDLEDGRELPPGLRVTAVVGDGASR
ncbi:MAG: efflux RND transporter periplasmic adaptor subunit [Bryobacteraceae bacterium]|nr:efflux RND transporter periplasmic adaptor subunit [Bryobacteraceae bacterium]